MRHDIFIPCLCDRCHYPIHGEGIEIGSDIYCDACYGEIIDSIVATDSEDAACAAENAEYMRQKEHASER